MAKFEIADNLTRINEGGYTNDKDDNGNWTGGKVGVGILVGTNKGISAPVLMSYLKRTPTVKDMKNISKETVRDIYKKNYWDVIRGDEIESQEKANQIYDMAVNAGVGTAVILAKRAQSIAENTKMDDSFINKLNQIT